MSAIDSIKKLDGEEFKQVNGFDNYYISNKGRCYNTKTQNFVGAYNKKGYVKVDLSQNHNSLKKYVHQLVMQYFGPPMPDNKTEVDHTNHIRDDNRIENLRWVTPSENHKNKAAYKGVDVDYIKYDDSPADLITVDHYGEHEFNDVYYSVEQNKFYFDTGVNFRILNVNMSGRGYAYVSARNVNNERISIYFNKFKREYGIESF